MQEIELNNIKCVIFDFDHTLYSGADWTGFYEYFNGLFVDIGAFSSADEAFNTMLEKYPNEPQYEQRAVFWLHENEHYYNKFMKTREDKIFDITNDHMQFFDYKKLTELSKFYKLYVISDSAESYVLYYMNKFGININDFEFVHGNKYLKKDITKYPLMLDAVKNSGAKLDEVIMVGDSKKYDMLPAQRLGIKFYLTQGVNDTENLVQKLIDLKK